MENSVLTLEQLVDRVKSSASSAIVVSAISTVSEASAVLELYTYLANQGGKLEIVSLGEISDEVSAILKDSSAKFRVGLPENRYVISIDYGAFGIEKVNWDINQDEEKLKFYLHPTRPGFTFDTVAYDHEGEEYGLLIGMGFANSVAFSEALSGKEVDDRNAVTISVNDTVEQRIAGLLGSNGSEQLRKSVALKSVEALHILEGALTKDDFNKLCELADQGVNVNELLQQKYFAKSYPNLELQIKMMQNVAVDQPNRIVWSSVSADEMKAVALDANSLDTTGRILFNISKDFDLAIALYEIAKDKVRLVVESNSVDKFSADVIAGLFGAEMKHNNESHAEIDIDGKDLVAVKKELLTKLKELYSVEVKGFAA